MNPFEKGLQESNYSEFVLEQIKGMNISESRMVELGGKSKADFRMVICYLRSTSKLKMKFKTKTSTDGNLWVMRIA